VVIVLFAPSCDKLPQSWNVLMRFSSEQVPVAVSADDDHRDAVAAEVLARLIRFPDELRAAGASDAAIAAADEIARTAIRLLGAVSRH
jgi:hypothetical protein